MRLLINSIHWLDQKNKKWDQMPKNLSLNLTQTVTYKWAQHITSLK